MSSHSSKALTLQIPKITPIRNAPLHSNQRSTLWGTALHVFESARRSGVNLDPKLFNALLSGGRGGRGASKQPGGTRRSLSNVPEAVVVPNLGNWGPAPTPAPRRGKTPPPALTLNPIHVPPLGEGPKRDGSPIRLQPHVLSQVPLPTAAILQLSHDSMTTSASTPTPPQPKGPKVMSVPLQVPTTAPTTLAASPSKPSSSSTAKLSIKLDLPVTLPPKPIVFASTPHSPATKNPSVGVTSSTLNFQSALNMSAPAVDVSSSIPTPSSISFQDLVWGQSVPSTPSTPAAPHRPVAPTMMSPKVTTAQAMAQAAAEASAQPIAPVINPVPTTVSFEDISLEWERRRQEEEKAQALAEEQRRLEEEEARVRKEIQMKNEHWVQVRGEHARKVYPTLVADVPPVPKATWDTYFAPTDVHAWRVFQESKSNRAVTPAMCRAVLERFAKLSEYDKVSEILKSAEVSKNREMASTALVYSIFLAGAAMDYEKVVALYQEAVDKKVNLPRRSIYTVLNSLLLGDHDWEKAVHVYHQSKTAIRDPFNFLDHHLLMAISRSTGVGEESKKSRTQRAVIIRRVHENLKMTMNEVGKFHNTALIQAYGSVRDGANSTAILKSYKVNNQDDDSLYSAYLISATPQQINTTIGELNARSGQTTFEPNLVAAAMISLSARGNVAEAWSLYRQAKAKGMVPKGKKLAIGFRVSLRGEEVTKENVTEAHNHFIQERLYNSPNVTFMITVMKDLDMNHEIIAAFEATSNAMKSGGLAPAVVQAYNDALKVVGGGGLHVMASQFVKDAVSSTPAEKKDKVSSSEVDSVAASIPIGQPEMPQDITTAEEESPAAKLADEKNTVLMEHARQRNWESAVAVLSEILEGGGQPSTFHYNCVLSASMEEATVVDAVFDHMKARGVAANVTTLNTVMNSRIRLNQWERAIGVFSSLPTEVRDVSSYTMALNATSKSDALWESSIAVLREMNKRNIRPTTLTYTMGLNSIVKSSWIHAVRVLQQMNSTKGVEIKPVTLNKVLQKLSEEGVEEVANVVKSKIKVKKS